MLMRHTTSTYIKLACSICYRTVILHVRLASTFVLMPVFGALFVTYVAGEEVELDDRNFCYHCCKFFVDD